MNLIPFNENDEDVLRHAQCPDRSLNPYSFSSSPESLASVHSTVPQGDPDEQWSQPENGTYRDEAGLSRFPAGHWHPGNIYNTDGPIERNLYDSDDSDDLFSVE